MRADTSVRPVEKAERAVGRRMSRCMEYERGKGTGNMAPVELCTLFSLIIVR